MLQNLMNLPWLKYSLKSNHNLDSLFIWFNILERDWYHSLIKVMVVFGRNYSMVSIFIQRIRVKMVWMQNTCICTQYTFEQHKKQAIPVPINFPIALNTVCYSKLKYGCVDFMWVCMCVIACSCDDDVGSRHQNTLQQKSTSCWHKCAYTKSVS